MKQSNQRMTRKQVFWKQHIDHWQNSALTQAEYCRQNNLRTKSFTYWKRRLKNLGEEVRFVPVAFDVPVTERSSAPITMTVDGQYSIEIPDGFSSATLAQVLRVLAEV